MRTTLKPAIRNGLTALIVILLAADVAAVVIRYGRDDRTRVSVAPAPSTTTSTTTSPTTETTVTATTVTATTSTTTPTTVAPAATGSADFGATTSTAPPVTTSPDAITGPPATFPRVVPAAPPVPIEHPHTGGHPLSLLALLLIGVGLAGLRLTRRARSDPSQ